jgi:hypothetical protein
MLSPIGITPSALSGPLRFIKNSHKSNKIPIASNQKLKSLTILASDTTRVAIIVPEKTPSFLLFDLHRA